MSICPINSNLTETELHFSKQNPENNLLLPDLENDRFIYSKTENKTENIQETFLNKMLFQITKDNKRYLNHLGIYTW